MKTLRTALAVALPILLGHTALARELPQFGPVIRAEYPSAEDGLLELSPGEPPGDLADGAEVVVLSGTWTTEAARRGVGVRVTIDRPGSKVLLALAAYQNVYWQVTATPGTRLAGILASGHHRPAVSANVAVPAFLTKDGYATHPSEYDAWLARMKRRFGVEKIDVFQAVGTIPPEFVITRLDPPRPAPVPPGEPKVQEPETNFAFKLLTADFKEESWTLTGPVGAEAGSGTADAKKEYWRGRLQAVSPDRTQLFVMQGDALLIRDPQTGRERPAAPMPARFPNLDWTRDLAYDSKRDLVALSTLGWEGFLYRFDVKAGKWLDFRSLQGVGTTYLTYDATADRYVAVGGDDVHATGGSSLAFFSGQGEHLFTRKIGEKLKNGSYSARLSTLLVAPHGDDIALVDTSMGKVRGIWHYNVPKDKVTLTYYRPERD